MFNSIKTLALSAMIGVSGMAALAHASHADSLYMELDGGDAGFGVDSGYRDAQYRHDDWIQRDDRRDWRRDWRDGRQDWRERRCSPERALDKAERIGLRRVALRDVTPRTITVSGRDRGDRVVVTFGRGPGCPILRY